MTVQSTFSIRKATREDAEALAKLIDIAGEGIPTWLWSRQCADGQIPLDVGRERAQRPNGAFSYANALVAEHNGDPLGMALGYAIEQAPDDDPDDLPAPIAPFVELEKHSVGTWYINALAVFPGGRGAGTGSGLMAASENLAREHGLGTMSIQVYGQNAGAVRLYRRLGYEPMAHAPVRLHPCQPYYTGKVLLLTKHLGR